MLFVFFLTCVTAIDPTIVSLVVASKTENLTWLDTTLPAYQRFIYHPNISYTGTRVNDNLMTQYDKAYEVCMYLRYIIDHYDNLNEYTIFMHAHESSWHSPKMVETIKRIIPSQPFTNLNYNCFMTLNDKIGYFERIHANLSHLIGVKPDRINTYCCAQMLIHRDLIRSHPLTYYVTLDQWIATTNEDSYLIALFFEYSWNFIFNQPNDMQPLTNAFCSLVNCTSEELEDKTLNFQFYDWKGFHWQKSKPKRKPKFRHN